MSTERDSGPDSVPHKHHRSLVELFEALLEHAERRFGITAHEAVELLRSVQEGERTRRELMRGIWTALVALLVSGIVGVIILGLKVWAVQ